ncbi:MAG: SsrA-binding protein SmpB [Candidatus Portnoybacteria bacterium]|nr:SsrA-binding protein SmpB [Candidatus Portnoybacteria bacterium]
MPVLAENKGVGTKYEILEKCQAGLSLEGQEVKAIRNHKATLRGSFVKIIDGEAFWVGGNIAPYQAANVPKTYRQDRPRKLLLRKPELSRLIGKNQEKGLTLIPLSLYTKGAWIKMELAVAKGLKKHDKREKIKEREFERRRRRLEGRKGG